MKKLKKQKKLFDVGDVRRHVHHQSIPTSPPKTKKMGKIDEEQFKEVCFSSLLSLLYQLLIHEVIK